MTLDDLLRDSKLESRHYAIEPCGVPIIDGSLYSTLGGRLFELYRKYKVSGEDQREIERISFLLMNFTMRDSLPQPGLWAKFCRWLRRK